MTADFSRAFADVIGEEGGYSCERADPGNWTGGKVGEGELAGTKFGLASSQWAANLARLPADVRAAMPAAVRDLALEQARTVYRLLYWEPHRVGELPPPLALLVFDTLVNGGAAGVWLQLAVGATPVDGIIGDGTLAAVAKFAAERGGAAICAEFLAERLAYLVSLPTWRTFGADRGKPKGWDRRLFMLPFLAMQMTEAPA